MHILGAPQISWFRQKEVKINSTCLSGSSPAVRLNRKQKNMTTQQVADRLVALCRKGEISKAMEELYSDDIVSIEPEHAPTKSAKGKKAVFEKGKQFASMIEERHGGSFSDPIVSGSYFSAAMMLDATFKGMGRMKLEEICVYEVKDGKIVWEQFYF